ncbi:MAG: hypothetical protein IPK08_13090 [Bacteroidetes bacterium]|nr:hypothetical protein [Bacteroidota bacterium]
MEVESPTVIVPPAITTVSYQKRKLQHPVLHPGRRPFPSHLPRVEVAIEPL